MIVGFVHYSLQFMTASSNVWRISFFFNAIFGSLRFMADIMERYYMQIDQKVFCFCVDCVYNIISLSMFSFNFNQI